MNKKILFLCIACVIPLFFSCASTKFSGTATLTGRVFASDGTAASGYLLNLDGKKVVTGTSGTFYVPNVKSGKIKVSGGKKGYSSVKGNFDFLDKRTILTINVDSMETIYGEVEELLRSGDVESAEKLLSSSSDFNSKEPLYRFYNLLVKYVKKPSEWKIRSLKKIMES